MRRSEHGRIHVSDIGINVIVPALQGSASCSWVELSRERIWEYQFKRSRRGLAPKFRQKWIREIACPVLSVIYERSERWLKPDDGLWEDGCVGSLLKGLKAIVG